MNTNLFPNALLRALLTALLFIIPVNAFSADEATAMSLLKKSKCLTCHSPDKKKDGPSYKKVAEKYRGKPEVISKLFKHLTEPSMVEIDGEEEEHGSVKTRDEDKINNLIEWILSLQVSVFSYEIFSFDLGNEIEKQVMVKTQKAGVFNRLWDALSRSRGAFSIITLIVASSAGMLFLVGFNTALEATNTMEFCISCHDMRDNVFQEYKETIHYSNSSGVRVSCADCHVPKNWIDKVVRKIEASKEVYGTMIGVIDTREKFEAKRHEMAVNVWRRMKTTDSLECRNCHSVEAMSKDEQSKRAWRRHKKGLAEGKTCIDCHFGLAHDEPAGPGPQEIDFNMATRN